MPRSLDSKLELLNRSKNRKISACQKWSKIIFTEFNGRKCIETQSRKASRTMETVTETSLANKTSIAVRHNNHLLTYTLSTELPWKTATEKNLETSLMIRPSGHTRPYSDTTIAASQITSTDATLVNQPAAPKSTTEAPCSNLDLAQLNITLHKACEEGKICLVQLILSQRPADVNLRGDLGRTPVMAAAVSGQKIVFDFLVSQGCDLSVVDNSKNSVLHLACEGGNTDIVQYLLYHNLDIESRGGDGWTPVMAAVRQGHIDVFDCLVRNGCNLKAVDKNKASILHIACINASLSMVMHIVRSHPSLDIDRRGWHGRTPAIFAAYFGFRQIVEFFISKGCNLTMEDDQGNNILHSASRGGHVDMVKYIHSLKIFSINVRGQNGKTPVMFAVTYCHIEVTKFLMDEGCNVTAVDDNKNNILHISCKCGNVDIVRYIHSLQLFDIDSKARYGMTPMMIAARLGHLEVVRFLVSKGCKVAIIDNKSNNVLHLACMAGHLNVVKYILLLNVCDINSRGEHGWTPIMDAALYGKLNVLEFLVRKGSNLRVADNIGNNILHLACMHGHLDVVKYIINQHALDIDATGGRSKKTPIMYAAYFGHMNVVEFLGGKGCKLTVLDKQRYNVLHVACMSGEVDVVEYILSLHKLDIDSRGKHGFTPVMCAIILNRIGVVRFLVGKGCNLSIVEKRQKNILHLACQTGKTEMVKYLMTIFNVDGIVKAKDKYGNTPVKVAELMGHTKIVALLKGNKDI